MLNCELAALLLLDGERVTVANVVGLPEPSPGAIEIDFAFAVWQLLSPNHEVLIIEDSAEDVRCGHARKPEHQQTLGLCRLGLGLG